MPSTEEIERKQGLVRELQDKFQSSLDHPAWRAWRAEAVKCFDYRDGEQWTTAEKKELAKRGQAPSVNNQVKVFLDYMLGKVIEAKTKTRFRGRNVPENEDTGHLLTELYLYTDQVNKYRYQEDDRNEDTACSGFGVSKTVPFYNEKLKQPDIKKTVLDCLDVYPDPYSSKYDWSDCMFVCEAPWVDVKEAQALYPKFKSQLAGLINNYSVQSDPTVDESKGYNYIDQNRERLRLVEIWWVSPKTKMTIFLPQEEPIDVSDWSDGKIKKKLKVEGSSLSRETVKEVDMAVFVDNILLEHRENPFLIDQLPYVPQFARRKKDGTPYSFVSLVIPIQDSINKRESKSLHILNNNQALYEEGAVEDEEEEAKNRARPDGRIKLNKGTLKHGRYQIVKNTELAVTQMNFHNQNLVDIRRVAGFNPDALGEKSEVRSGVGIARKQAAGQVTIVRFLANLNRTRENEARLWMKYVKKFYTSQMTFYITGDVTTDFKPKNVTINQTDEFGFIRNDITLGDHDVVIEQMKDTSTMHDRNVEILATTIPQIASLGPGWAKLLLKFLDLPGKEEVLAQFDAMMKPQPEIPKISLNISWDNLSEEDKEHFRNLIGIQVKEQLDPNLINQLTSQQGGVLQ